MIKEETPQESLNRLTFWLAEYCSGSIDMNENSVSNVIRLLSNLPESGPEIDPLWVPIRVEEMPEFAQTLDYILMRFASRDSLNQIRNEILELTSAKGDLYQDQNRIDSCLKRRCPG